MKYLIGLLALCLLVFTSNAQASHRHKHHKHFHHHHVTSHVTSAKLALGDSLAVGFGEASHAVVVAKVGASSLAIAAMVPHRHFDAVLISAGTNDPPGPFIETVRMRVAAWVHPKTVTWVIPVNGARQHVLDVAKRHGDNVRTYLPSQRAWPHPDHYYRFF